MLNLIGEGLAKGAKKAAQETAEDAGEKAISKVAKKAAKKTRANTFMELSKELSNRYGADAGRKIMQMYDDGKMNSTLSNILSGKETQGPLLMYHAVEGRKLAELANNLGNKVPNPSLQIVDPQKNIGGNFGDVILLGNKDMAYSAGRYGGIDTNKKTNIFGRDIYSSRRPTIVTGEDGNSYIMGTRKLATPENISAFMNRGPIRGTEMSGPGAVAAQVTPQFKNLSDVIRGAGRLQPKDAVKKSNDAWSDAVFNAIDEMKYAQDLPANVSYNNYMQGIQDLLGNKSLAKRGFTGLPEWANGLYDNDTARKELVKLADMGEELPTDYFELKANRPIDMSEFSGAILPEDFGNTTYWSSQHEQDVLKFLEDNNIPIVDRYFVGADGSSDRSKEAIFKKLAQQDRLKTPYLLGLATLLGGGATLGYNNKKEEG